MKKRILAFGLLLVSAVAYAAAGDKYLFNSNQDKDVHIRVNDGGVEANVLTVRGDNSTVGINGTPAASDAQLNVSRTSSTAYTSAAPSVTTIPFKLLNTANHVSGGVQTGIQMNLTGDSQNRVVYIGAVSQSAANRKADFVVATDDGSGRAEKLRVSGDGVAYPKKYGVTNTIAMADDTIGIISIGTATMRCRFFAWSTFGQVGEYVEFFYKNGAGGYASGPSRNSAAYVLAAFDTNIGSCPTGTTDGQIRFSVRATTGEIEVCNRRGQTITLNVQIDACTEG